MSLFTANQGTRQKLNKFDLSHERKLSFNMGELIPMFLEEILPGDRFQVNSEIMLRLAPMISPMMHRVNVYTHFFFVPSRIIYQDFEEFITGGDKGDEFPTVPYMTMSESNRGRFTRGSLADYFGIPPILDGVTVNQEQNISALPFRAYSAIWNEYYRDQNLQDKIVFATTGGGVSVGEGDAISQLQIRAWEKDYFTSALPYAQKGPEVILPAQINYKQYADVTSDGATIPTGGTVTTDANAHLNTNGSLPLGIENIDDLGLTINDLRRSTRLQEWLEKTARSGSRMKEMILSHFGVLSDDARLDRPEYLGGGKSPVVISEVLNTTGGQNVAEPQLPQGNMSGHGISVGSGNRFKRSFKEHGHVIGIMSVMPKTSYQDGISRLWTRDDKFDFYWPSFAQLGEQEVKQREIKMDYATNTPDEKDETFGYQSRFAEYKFQHSSVHGDFRDTLDFWHMGRKFDGSTPALNDGFIAAKPTDRIFAVTDPDEHKLYCQVYNSVSALRPMPRFNNPTL